MNRKGFMMAEVVVVSAIVLITLVSFYVSYNKIISVYNKRIDYYDVATLYDLASVRDNINDFSGYNSMDKVVDEQYKKVYYLETSHLKSLDVDNQTFKEYLDYLDNAVTFKSKDILIMEKCLGDDINNCKYAYLEASAIVEDEDLIEDRIRLVNCRGTASEHDFFVDGGLVTGCCAYVGLYGTVNKNYVAKYTFNTDESQIANNVKVIVRPAFSFYDNNTPSGTNYDTLRFYIEEAALSDNSYQNANGSFNYTADLFVIGDKVDSGYSDMPSNGILQSKLEGTGNVKIKPNTKYYLWIFSDNSAAGIWRFDYGNFDAFVDIVLNPKSDSSFIGTQCCWNNGYYTCG